MDKKCKHNRGTTGPTEDLHVFVNNPAAVARIEQDGAGSGLVIAVDGDNSVSKFGLRIGNSAGGLHLEYKTTATSASGRRRQMGN